MLKLTAVPEAPHVCAIWFTADARQVSAAADIPS